MPTPLEEQSRNKETEYFLRKEKELIERLRQKAEEEARHQELAEASGLADEAVLSELRELGFDRETVSLMHLIPMLSVAWADGEMSVKEKELVLSAAKVRGIEPGSPGFDKLRGWLESRPPQVLFDRTLVLVRALLAAIPEERGERAARTLYDQCVELAAASGGFLGIGKISPEEKAVLESLSRELATAHSAATQKVLSRG